jgi:hypothetical protein
MSNATKYSISGCQGDELALQLIITDINGDRLNLSGNNVRGKVRYSYGYTGDALLDLQPIVFSGASGEYYSSGIVNINISATGMAAMPVGRFFYDIERYSGDPSGFSTKILKGSFWVAPEVTY